MVYKGPAGGWDALASSFRHIQEQGMVGRGMATMLRANQAEGFDCPGCAWPHRNHHSTFEFCENGVKAVTAEATSRRVTAEFFATHSVSALAEHDDHFLGAQAGLALIAAISAPTALAITLAEQDGITLIGFARGARMTVYSHVRGLRACALPLSSDPPAAVSAGRQPTPAAPQMVTERQKMSDIKDQTLQGLHDEGADFGDFYPTHYVMAAFPDEASARAACETLLGQGYPVAECRYFSDRQVERATRHGLDTAGIVSTFGATLKIVERQNLLAKEGCHFVLVKADGKERTAKVKAALEQHGYRIAFMYHLLVIETYHPDNEPDVIRTAAF